MFHVFAKLYIDIYIYKTQRLYIYIFWQLETFMKVDVLRNIFDNGFRYLRLHQVYESDRRKCVYVYLYVCLNNEIRTFPINWLFSL